MLCECQALPLGLDVVTAADGCLHCGAPVDVGRWRCDGCQIEHDAHRDRVREIVDGNRRAVADALHGEDHHNRGTG